MFPEHGSQKDKLRECFSCIREEALGRLNRAEKYRLYTHEELAALSGSEPEEWKGDGRIRRMMYGVTGRLWLLNEFQLWFKADEEDYAGLLFTAEPRTGYLWLHDQKTDAVIEAATSLEVLGNRAEELDSRFRGHFRAVRKCGKAMMAAGQGLNKLRQAGYLRRLGIAPPTANGAAQR